MKKYLANTFFILLSIIIISSCGSPKTTVNRDVFIKREFPKREFRGAWIQTAWQDRYRSMNSSQMKNYFTDLLDKLHAAGINAVIFQVRPQADAFYYSELEPWSHFMTGVQGKGLPDGFDPLKFLISECHRRNMELHAWLNPYRVKTSENQILSRKHVYYQHPERFIKYGTQLFFDPGLPENRAYICRIIKDILKRYDIDAIHMDDYFYPYPIPGKDFPDNRSFDTYANRQGFSASQRDDWRRNNVNLLIKEIKETLIQTKPWVRFGISPFGIYRNKRSTLDGSGSNTTGLQNYDDLYADIKLWVKNGWIDYNMPQIYWEIGHKSADYTTLLQWWAENNFEQPLYIGQDVTRTLDAKQLDEKMHQVRHNSNVHGNSFWSGYNIAENYKGAASAIKQYQQYPALIPAYIHMSKHAPKKVKNIREIYTKTSHILEWQVDKFLKAPEEASYFVVYRFKIKDPIDIEDPRHIVALTKDPFLTLPYEDGQTKYKYIITSVNAFHIESKGKFKKSHSEMTKKTFPMIAKTMSGLEDVLAKELIELGADEIQIGRRMVSFCGDQTLLYKANICCRTALRILKPIHSFTAKNPDEVYAEIKKIKWFDHMTDNNTFAVDSVVFSNYFTHSKFVAYRVKDAIVDYFVQRTGKRPSVSVTNPDILINIHIAENICTLSLDSSGESLHKRGYRSEQTEAPLNEVLAAGIILKTGWQGETDFIDPMCGSGTLLIEAAMIAMNIPPGIYRKNFAFERWNDFNPDLFDLIYNDESQEREFHHKIYGSDILSKAISIAAKNVKNAGLSKYIELETKPLQQYKETPSENGILITNPPYGERIKPDDLLGLYSMIGERLKHVFAGYTAWVLSYKKECFNQIGLKHSKRIPLINGSLECELREYKLFAGKKYEK